FDVSTAPLIERLYYCYQSYLRLRPADSPHHPDAFADPIDETQLPYYPKKKPLSSNPNPSRRTPAQLITSARPAAPAP
ncbi:MAG: hypothetical protein ACK5ZU_16460, partial [Acidobacteriota bacterium]